MLKRGKNEQITLHATRQNQSLKACFQSPGSFDSFETEVCVVLALDLNAVVTSRVLVRQRSRQGSALVKVVQNPGHDGVFSVGISTFT